MKYNSKSFLMRLGAGLSISVAFILISIKLCAFLWTGALSILSSLIDSGFDLLAAVINAIAIHLALKPANARYRFGHGKAESIGAFIQSVFLCISAIFLLSEAYQHFKNNTALEHLPAGVVVMVISTLLTLALIYVQRRIVKKTQSMAILGDSVHYTGDTCMNIGVLISLFLSYWLKITWIDEVFAVCVAAYLLKSSLAIFLRVLGVLMDKELDSPSRKAIQRAVLVDKNIHGIYRLKTRTTGSKSFVQFYAKINKDLNLQQTHELCNRMEKAVHEVLPNAEVIIHPVPK